MPYESKMKFVVQRLNGDWLKFTDEGLPPESPKRWVFLPGRQDVAVFSSRGGAEDRAGIAGVAHDEIEVFPHNQQGRQGEIGYVSREVAPPESGGLLLELTMSLSAALGEPKHAVPLGLPPDQLRNVWGHLIECVKNQRDRRHVDLAMAYELRSALGLAELLKLDPAKTDRDVRALWDKLIRAVSDRVATTDVMRQKALAQGRFEFQTEVARAAYGHDADWADTEEARGAVLLFVHTLRDRTDALRRLEALMEEHFAQHILDLFKAFRVAPPNSAVVASSWEGARLAVELAKEASELRLRQEVRGANESIIHGLLGALDPYKHTLRNESNEVELPRVIARVKSLSDFRSHVVNILDQGMSAAREAAKDNKKPMTERLLSAFKHDVFNAVAKELLKPIADEEPIEAA